MRQNDYETRGSFRAETTQILRFGDTDQQGHINNAVYATFFESGRVEELYNKKYGLPPRDTAFVLAQININFIAEIRFPGEVIIATRVSHIGNASMKFEQSIFVDDVAHATAQSTVVMVDMKTRRSMTIPDDVRAHFETLRA